MARVAAWFVVVVGGAIAVMAQEMEEAIDFASALLIRGLGVLVVIIGVVLVAAENRAAYRRRAGS